MFCKKHAKTIAAFSLICQPVFAGLITQDARAAQPSVPDQLAQILQTYSLPAIAISENAGTGQKQAQVGLRRLGEASHTVQATDTWHLGSNTKAMTATTIALLVQDCLLDWDSTVGAILDPTHQLMSEDFVNVTIGELATHHSGITGTFGIDNIPLLPSQMLELYEASASVGRALAGTAILSVAATGTRGSYEYSNNNYIILGLVIDAVAGVSAEQVIEDRLWKPFNMTTAGWGVNRETSATSVENPWPHLTNLSTAETYPYRQTWPVDLRDYAPYMNTAGRAHMSLADYDKWLRLHVDEAARSQVGLSDEQLQILHTTHVGDEATGNETLYTYGGWIQTKGGCTTESACLVHTGSNTMNVAYAFIDTGRNLTLASATNGPYLGGVEGTQQAVELMLNGTLSL
jgi:D-alanyl-D-alanine carboxypeptidase